MAAFDDFGRDMDQIGRDISESVRSAMENLPKDIGSTIHEAMADLFEESGIDHGAETVERSFDVGPRAELDVSNVSGTIRIHSADIHQIVVRATKRGSRRRMEHTRIETDHQGNRVVLKTRSEQGARFGLRGGVCSVDYDILVPRECSIDADAVSADLVIDGTTGEVSIRTVSGDVSMHGITGDCSLTTVSGDVVGGGLVGELKLRTTSGDATIRESSFRSFNLNTVSGDFTIHTPLTMGEHYLAKTVSGDLQIVVPPNTGATVQLKSVSGDVSTDLPAEIIKASRRSWQGRINGGGANVEMSSVSGDLRITSGSGRGARAPQPEPAPPHAPHAVHPATPVAPVPPAPWVAPTAPEPTAEQLAEPETAGAEPREGSADTADVLRRLAQGEISVEEAMAQLDALDR